MWPRRSPCAASIEANAATASKRAPSRTLRASGSSKARSVPRSSDSADSLVITPEPFSVQGSVVKDGPVFIISHHGRIARVMFHVKRRSHALRVASEPGATPGAPHTGNTPRARDAAPIRPHLRNVSRETPTKQGAGDRSGEPPRRRLNGPQWAVPNRPYPLRRGGAHDHMAVRVFAL